MSSDGSPASLRVANQRVYVAVGRDVEESKSTLLWALDNFGGHFRVLHVHQPNQISSNSRQHNNNGIRSSPEIERQNMHGILDAYIHICNQAEVHAEKRYLEKKDVGKGIVELIEEHAITKLVMGAAANIHYSEGMTGLRSTKAMFVNQHAHPSCQIWFVCNGHLIDTRDGNLNMVDMDVMPTLHHSSANSAESNLNAGEVDNNVAMVPYERGETSESNSPPSYNEILSNEIYGRLERVMMEAENERHKAFQELLRREKDSERAAVEATNKANFLSQTLIEESRRRQELEEVLARKTEQFESRNRQQEQGLLVARDNEVSLQIRIAGFETTVRELTEKLTRSEELFRICREKSESMEAERDDAVRATEELRSNGERCLSEFSFVEIQRGTDNFNPSMVIEEHSYGTVYRGFLRHTNVAIKMFQTDSNRARSVFHQETDIMSKLRHPNVATLIGICQEPRALIYEHFSNGNLEDRLACNDETTPMPWQTRVRIAAEICATLVFLHTNRPHCFVHGNLKPKNVLLDGNFTVKLFNFGTFGQRPDPNSTSPHLDPYFLTSGEPSAKSDVYSFGIVVLLLLTGRSAVNLAREMQGAVDGRNTSYLTTLLDPLAGEWPISMAMELARLGLKCCDMEQNTRPDLGSEVWNILEPIRDNFYELDEEEEAELQPPDYFLCPISQEVMQEPVVAADGFTYEGDALRRWLNSGHRTSPMTGAELSNLVLVPNHPLRSGIQQWLQDH